MLKKLLIALGVIVGVLVGLGVLGVVLGPRLAMMRGGGGGGGYGQGGQAVTVEEAQTRPITVRVSAPGRLEASENVEISARVSARIAELPFEEGDKVSAGDVLVRLDATDLDAAVRGARASYAAQQVDMEVSRARLEATEARLVADEASLADAVRELGRKDNLLETRDISQAEVDTARTRVDRLTAELRSARTQFAADRENLRAMEHRLEVAQTQIEQAQDRLDDAVITSPIDGTVTRLNAEVGELVVTGTMNNAGTVILEVADLDEMLVVAQIDEADVAGVEVGQSADVTIDAYPDVTFKGSVKNVALSRMSALDLQEMGGTGGNSNSYKAEILLDGQGRRLLTDLTADVEILTQTFADPLTVPTQAVLGYAVDDLPADLRDAEEVRDGKTRTPVVFVVDAGKTKVRPVRVGESDLDHTIIESGIAAGEQVVTGPYSIFGQLRDEMNVTIEGTPTPTTPPTPTPTDAGTDAGGVAGGDEDEGADDGAG